MESLKGKIFTISKDIRYVGSGPVTHHHMVHPVAIGNGAAFLKDIHTKINLVLTKTRSFKTDIVLLCYQPKKNP